MTLSFNDLGNAGRLGNQMFQYAALRGIAANRGLSWMIPPEGSDRADNYGLFEGFKLTNCKEENQGEQFTRKRISWREFHFNEDIYNKIEDGSYDYNIVEYQKFSVKNYKKWLSTIDKSNRF